MSEDFKKSKKKVKVLDPNIYIYPNISLWVYMHQCLDVVKRNMSINTKLSFYFGCIDIMGALQLRAFGN